MPDLFRQLETALLAQDVAEKCELTAQLILDWQQGQLAGDSASRILALDEPGQPALPVLVDPRRLERRSFATAIGRLRLLHALAHIEFNAINIALDAVYRFRGMPDKFIGDWLRVAAEEAQHFGWLNAELVRRDSFYGAHRAHRGLWDMVCKTRHSLLHRMALVPRVMEARGLDVTPAMIAKCNQVDDLATAAILQRIYQDEIGHVRIGNYWFRLLCEQQMLDADKTFRQLVLVYMGGNLRGPFNRRARLEAGFDEAELAALEQSAVAPIATASCS